ncbi:MAG: hypothetical protein ACYTFW_08015 [Planctomycetota bacterium]|jgi:hypothetical protein
MEAIITKKVTQSTLILAVAATMLCVTALSAAAELEWPRDIVVPEGTISLYQPQLESFNGDRLTARAAVSVTSKGETEPVFGAVWIAARVSTDRDTRIVTLLSVEVPQVKFPDIPMEKAEKLKTILKTDIPKWQPSISLDRLLTMLDLTEKEKIADDQLKSTPPKIIYVTHPAVLVVIDGEPQLSQVEDSSLMQVVNTPFFIVLDPKAKRYYLKGGEEWFFATDISGPWKKENNPPASAVALAAKEFSSDSQAPAQSSTERMPQIIVSTEPTELVITDGQPKYTPIDGTDLLYVSNTESDLFMHIGTQLHFVLLSGRWYASTKLTGPWSYVAADKLPVSFAKIPPDSAKGHVLAQVSGTQQAREAILETYIPQTAAINRSEVKVVVIYDGSPKFVKIEGTDMYYAVNTSNSVIRYGSMYYCCHDAVWFVASNPLGPWELCVAVPQIIYTIPPSCPVYRVKYVYVYSYTPTVVYVGYTPGYVGCYVYGGTVVYGTGYVYRGWYGTVYYPRPATWGVAVRYNPNTGNWAVAVGRRGYYGGWRAGYRHTDININVNRNIYARQPARPGVGRPGIGRPGVGTPGVGRPGVGRPGQPSVGRPPVARPATTPARRNNVYADRNGNVHRKTNQGWQQKTSSGWTSSKPSSSNLDRQNTARQRGTSRTQNYQRSRSTGSSGRVGRRR